MKDIFALLTRPIPRSVMLGSRFHYFFQELNKSQWYPPEKLARFQESKLRALIEHAYRYVPYYHNVFKERNIKPSDIKTIEDLNKLPILTKEDVREYFGQLVAVNAKDYRYGVGKTGGTTTVPLTFLLDQQNREIAYAGLWRQRAWANISFSSKVASFRGTRWRNFERGKPCWKQNALSKEVDFNMLGIDKKMLETYVARLKQFRPDLIEGWPSAIFLLAKHILEDEAKVPFPKCVQTSSEMLSDYQRTIIEKGFCCKVYDWYGQSEYVVSAGQCPEGTYHISESGIMEFIRDAAPVGEDEVGELVGTGLYNYSMPLIRYRIGDVGKFTTEKCNCGRGLAILKSLEGRIRDIIVTPDERFFTGNSLGIFWRERIRPHVPNIEYVRIIQKAKDRLVVEVVKRGYCSNAETQIIRKELKGLMGSQMRIEFKQLNCIPTGEKWRFTTSELNIDLI